jgi:phosphodiesterase/alkaline phosphatase D-like protein
MSSYPFLDMAVVLLSALSFASAYAADVALINISISKLAFGSCNRHDLPQPLWKSIGKQRPDIFLWLGDVVYADSRVAPFVWRSSELSVVRQRFDEQKKKPEYKVYVRTNK